MLWDRIRHAIPEEWNTSEEAVPELAGIEWAKAPRKDGVYLLADGREFRDAKPVKPPAPNFPAAALSQEGVCSIGFSVERDGHTSNIRVSCSDPLFLSAAQSAAENTLFDPARIDQVPVVRNKVVYPLYFCQRN